LCRGTDGRQVDSAMAETMVLVVLLMLAVVFPLWGWYRWRRHALVVSGAKCMSESWMREHVYRDGVTRGE